MTPDARRIRELERQVIRIIAECAETARKKVEQETGDKYLANRIWHAVADVKLPTPTSAREE